MNIIRKLTLANLKENRNRTIVSILGVVLSTALILAVAGMAQSGQASLAAWQKQDTGDFHTLFTNLAPDDVLTVSGNANVSESAVFYTYGYAALDHSLDEYMPYVYVVGGNEKAFQKLSLHLIEGRFPEQENELLITDYTSFVSGKDLKVGDTLTLSTGRRVATDGTELYQSDYYTGTEESLTDTVERTYTIVGICQRLSHVLEDYEAPGMTSFTYAADDSGALYSNVAVTFTRPASYATYTSTIVRKILDKDPESHVHLSINKDLLEYEGALSSRTLTALYTVAGLILLIIVLTSVFVIRNSFAISVSEKTRQYGMLASVGATARQIRSSVLFEGLIIGLFGIPLGLLLGYGAIAVLIQILNHLLADMLGTMRFHVVVSPWILLLTVVLGALTIYLSCLLPAIRAGRITPIEAIRSNQDVRIRSGKLKVSPLTRKLFGIGGVIAAKNLKRSRRKYRTTVISLVVSIAVFIALSSFVTMGQRIIGTQYTDYSYNLRVYGVETAELSDQLCQQLEETDYTYYYQPMGQLLSKECLPYAETYPEDYDFYVNLVVLGQEDFAQYLKENGIKADPKEAVLLNDETEVFYDGSMRVERITTLEAGDSIPVRVDDKLDLDMTVTARVKSKPTGFEHVYSDQPMLIVGPDYFPEEVMENAYLSPLYIQSKTPNQTEAAMLELAQSDARFQALSVTNLHRDAMQERNLILVIEIFLYGFIIVITLIGVTNIFNTISTNMLLRRREFAMLQSIGMTRKAFHRMIFTENILYSSKSLLIGIPLGLLGSFALYKASAMRIDVGYQIPWTAILLSIVFVFLIVGLTMLYSLRKMNGQNIIETIRSENT